MGVALLAMRCLSYLTLAVASTRICTASSSSTAITAPLETTGIDPYMLVRRRSRSRLVPILVARAGRPPDTGVLAGSRHPRRELRDPQVLQALHLSPLSSVMDRSRSWAGSGGLTHWAAEVVIRPMEGH